MNHGAPKRSFYGFGVRPVGSSMKAGLPWIDLDSLLQASRICKRILKSLQFISQPDHPRLIGHVRCP